MALTTYQTAQTNWSKRANQFATAGIPQGQWSKLYYQDMAGVYQGRQPMSDAEVYSGVVSAVQGPQIQDPTRPVGHGSLLSHIGHVLGNIPSDVAGMVTGLEGIPHILAHLPSEIDNTGKLLYNLADGNNAWLQKNGYLQPGDQLHESWGDFATILRAMNENGSKQLLPFLPFISDIADMTSGQGRQYLQQHPVGALLDILPGVVKVGHLATDSLSLEANAAERGAAVNQLIQKGYDSKVATAAIDKQIPPDYSNIYRNLPGQRKAGDTTPKFYAAGRALQQGNPVKALVSAAGDLISVSKDDFGAKVTPREYINMRAASAGLDKFLRENFNRPLNNISDEMTQLTRYMRNKVFGKSIWSTSSVDRIHDIYMGTHGVNPQTGERWTSVDEYNTWVNTHLTPHERADIDTARTIADNQRTTAVAQGRGEMIADPVTNVAHFYATDSKVYKAFHRKEDAAQRLEAAAQSGNADRYLKAHDALDNAIAEFNKVRGETVPDEWQFAITNMMKSGAKQAANDAYSGEMLKKLTAAIDSSIWEDDFKRLFDEDGYNALKQDALDWWRYITAQGYEPLWTHAVDPKTYDSVLYPTVGRIDKPVTPAAFAKESPRDYGMYFGDTVFNVAALITNHAVEEFREQAVIKFINEQVIPHFTVDLTQKKREYAEAISSAAQQGKLKVGPWTAAGELQRLIDQDFKVLNPQSFGLKDGALDVAKIGDRYITKEAAAAINAIYNPSKFPLTGTKTFRKGTALYKFSVLTGPRHFIHVSMGGLMFMLGRDPYAVKDLFRSARILRSLRTGEKSAEDIPALADMGLKGRSLSGIRGRVYNLTQLHQYWNTQVGVRMSEDAQISWIHEAKQKGVKAAEYIPNKLSQMEENIMDMYRLSTFLSKYRNTHDATAALEAAHKVFVDVNGMSEIERTVVKQLFPFYAFSRHLFKYLFTYPVDYPLRAAIISQFAEGEQQDWTSGLPRSYMSLFFLGQPDKNGNIAAFDLKNLNPFRSFANDFSLAGFFSSLSPFLTGITSVAGINSLSGTTQLYPGTTYNPQTGTLQATTPPGGIWALGESFLPQIGILDHYFKFTNQTRMLYKFDRTAYSNQLWNMLNVPLHPEVINVPYEKEITEMRRFRQAQTDVTALEDNPSAKSVSKVMEWNLVPWDNYLIPPAVLAAYYKRVAVALDKSSATQSLAPKAILPAPPTHPAVLGSY